jgi:hypothetical protein
MDERENVMFEYVLVVYWTMQTPEYQGHFQSCGYATEWCKVYCEGAEYTSCLHEDYIYLPKDFIKKEVKL